MPQIWTESANEAPAVSGGQSGQPGCGGRAWGREAPPQTPCSPRVQSTAGSGKGGAVRRLVVCCLKQREKQTHKTTLKKRSVRNRTLKNLMGPRVHRLLHQVCYASQKQNKDKMRTRHKSLQPAGELGDGAPRPGMGWRVYREPIKPGAAPALCAWPFLLSSPRSPVRGLRARSSLQEPRRRWEGAGGGSPPSTPGIQLQGVAGPRVCSPLRGGHSKAH